jgi:hypothetical protein
MFVKLLQNSRVLIFIGCRYEVALEKATCTVEMVLIIRVQNTVITGDTETEFQIICIPYTNG